MIRRVILLATLWGAALGLLVAAQADADYVPLRWVRQNAGEVNWVLHIRRPDGTTFDHAVVMPHVSEHGLVTYWVDIEGSACVAVSARDDEGNWSQASNVRCLNSCPGDLNADRVVGAEDYTILVRHWGSTCEIEN